MYIGLVGILFFLAIFDLVVGVSNDAVNFLNSAVASKAAPRFVIMIVASLGILLGAAFSSGMMEVARSGIFNPQYFYFNEIMLIFLTAMMTDIILLDLFNTYGLPTSTTVSLVFELLGAAVAMAVIKIMNTSEQTLLDLGNYINTSKLSAIVFSILASVLVGFICSVAVQYLARLLFTFKLRKTLKYYGAVWGGACVAIISYFILFKGMKGSSLIPGSMMEYIQNNVGLFMLILFVVVSIIFQLLFIFFKTNPLKAIILYGTFALSMAFAGNDLVNFIGVPMAGLNSYEIYAESGLAANELKMSGLKGAVPTNELILLAAGIVMILTLWLSKKAKTVMRTEINLSSSQSSEERFSSTSLSRSVVKMFIGIGGSVAKIIPERIQQRIDKRFKPDVRERKSDAAYDLLRASVNLMVASTLIAFGTSLKLPLSTTYITFMVAMGSSLSDGAWGRESAVYRVTGVFTVIGGWFITALIAFVVAITIGCIVNFGGLAGIIVMLAGIVFILLRTNRLHKKKEEKLEQAKQTFIVEKEDVDNIHQIANDKLTEILNEIPLIYYDILDGLRSDSPKKLRNIQKREEELEVRTTLFRNKLNETTKLISESMIEDVHNYIQSFNYLRELIHSLSFVINKSFEHTNNSHKPLLEEQIYELKELVAKLSDYFTLMNMQITQNDYSQMEELNALYNQIMNLLDFYNKKQMKRVKNGACGTKNSLLFLNFISNTKNLMLFAGLIIRNRQ